MQTCRQKNPRVNINWGMVFEALDKSKMCENKKWKKRNPFKAKLKKILIWKYLALPLYFGHNFLYICTIDLILAATRRRLEYLQLCSSPQILKNHFEGQTWAQICKWIKFRKLRGFTSQIWEIFLYFFGGGWGHRGKKSPRTF